MRSKCVPAKLAVALTTSLCAAVLAGAASAQQTPPAQTQQSQPGAGQGPGAGSGAGQGQAQGQVQGHGMGHGYGMGYGHGMGGMGGMGYGGGRDMSEQDRAAFFAARLASVRAGLVLTPEQEKLWPPLESAVRDSANQRQAWRERMQKEGRPASPVDAMRRMAEMSTARGETLKRVADAAAPLYNSLSDDQKRRLNTLAGGGMGAMMGLGGGMSGEGAGRGYGGGRHQHDHYRGHHHRDRHEGERGPRWRQGSDQQEPRFGRGSRNASASGGFDRGARLEDWRRL